MLDSTETPTVPPTLAPTRVHHSSWVVTDQERTRAFYEDIIGLKLQQFWIETVPFEGELMVMSHAFYEMPDHSALTFFNFPDPKFHEKFKAPKTEMFNHFAFKIDSPTLDRLKAELDQAGFHTFVLEHGYCRSLYTQDPDGLRLEFAVDSPRIDEIILVQHETAHDTLKEWMNGRRTTNNIWRTDPGH